MPGVGVEPGVFRPWRGGPLYGTSLCYSVLIPKKRKKTKKAVLCEKG